VVRSQTSSSYHRDHHLHLSGEEFGFGREE
jgi:hypothetical protein